MSTLDLTTPFATGTHFSALCWCKIRNPKATFQAQPEHHFLRGEMAKDCLKHQFFSQQLGKSHQHMSRQHQAHFLPAQRIYWRPTILLGLTFLEQLNVISALRRLLLNTPKQYAYLKSQSSQIWLKDAVQCRSCKMTCHKKCVNKCQATAICAPCDDDPLAMHGISPARGPEIVTTEADETALATEIATTHTPQVLFQIYFSARCFLSMDFWSRAQKEG
jgi:hypothetical protein